MPVPPTSPLWGESTTIRLLLQVRFCGRRQGASDTEPTPLPTFGETVQVTEGGDVETLFYPAMLYTSRRIFIQTHYVLWKHPVHRDGAIPHSSTPIGKDIQDRECGLLRMPRR